MPCVDCAVCHFIDIFEKSNDIKLLCIKIENIMLSQKVCHVYFIIYSVGFHLQNVSERPALYITSGT